MKAQPYRVRSLQFRPAAHEGCCWAATLVLRETSVAKIISWKEGEVDILDVEFTSDVARRHFIHHARSEHPDLDEMSAAEEELATLVYAAYCTRSATERSKTQLLFALDGDNTRIMRLRKSPMTDASLGVLRLAYGQRLTSLFYKGVNHLPAAG